ncbi:TfoX/Sxy family protein [Gemmatimonas sp.]|uniref:TfoX/Sxy family protein n=1 Tax=Gemmatimonas sp. TaxID=1962908 RepID=UPI0033402A34
MDSDQSRSRAKGARNASAADTAAEASLARLRNLGPVSAHLLVSAGIRAPQELRALGAVGAFRRVLFHRAGRVSTNLLWALEGALRNERWDRLDAETRAQLLAELNGGSLAVPDSARQK